MMNLAAAEIRRLHRKVAQLDRRVALANVPGKVASVDPATRTLRLEIGKDSEGKPVLSPPVRWQEAGAGTLKIHSEPKVGEQMVMSSPSGTIGAGSIAMRGTYDADNAAPSKASDATLIEVGSTKLSLKDGEFRFESGGSVATLSAAGLVITGGQVTHEGKNIGSDHEHTQVVRGAQQSGPPA